ncbi:MAG: MCP four helix bundle domain-containing protein, partial [Hydrogenovibrio sp.]|nr:MCP four helix bundle domain-containing protein [Hydrogenovibrio sp.]
MSIRVKLFLSFFLMVALTIALGVVAYLQVNKLSGSQKELVNSLLPKVIAVEKIIIYETRTQQYIREYMLTSSPSVKAEMLKGIASNRKENKKLTDYLQTEIHSARGKALLAAFEQKHAELVKVNNRVSDLDSQGKTAEAAALLISDESKSARLAQRDALQNLVDYQKKLANDRGQEGIVISDFTETVVMVLLLIVILVAVGLVLYILKSVVRPINYMKQVMLDVVKEGDFN